MRFVSSMVLLLLSSAAQAEQMHLVSNSGMAPNRHTDWMDSDTRSRSGNMVSFWIESLFETPHRDGVDRTMTFYRGDCAAMRVGVIQTMRLFADGRPSQTSAGDMNARLAATTSTTRPLLAAACSAAPLRPAVLNRRSASELMWRTGR